MSLLYSIALAAILLLLGVKLAACWLLRTSREAEASAMEQWPPVAVLLAVRNEAPRLSRCLNALSALDYPAEKLQVWIGNDASEDETKAVAGAFCQGRAGWRVLDIEEDWGQAKGKANVLAQLAHAAGEEPEFFFITDADVAVSASWIKSMLGHFTPEVAIVSGTCIVEGRHFFARMQRFDWALNQGLAKAYSLLRGAKKTLTVFGNNMAVRKEAYRKVGGFASIPFSVTEDFELHRQLSRLGYRSLHTLDPTAKSHTLPIERWKNLLHQRRRWMEGALQLPWFMVTILFVQALFFPAVLLLLFVSPLLGVGVWIAKVWLQRLVVRQFFSRIQEPSSLPFFGFEIYLLFLGLNLLVFYLLPFSFSWKGRRYR
ncbi:glycosyltransferase family 2 protein [Nafulsella turpanensis]|uniref:glycosyltransferase family 2 protein n=1 Tax=Nafulsella turpanensis TaxID=1265690 RepID=UPI00034BDB85|nr:glycosyltransferase family 2 protein [Nafulsella turpanensis]